MLKPQVKARDQDGLLIADFWDCLRLDPAPVQDLRKLFEAHVQKGARADLVIDLNGVGYAGSAALGGFISLRKLSQSKGGRVVFCNVDPTVFEVFRVSRLDPLFTWVADLPKALELLATPDGALPRPSTPPSPAEPRVFPAPSLRRRKP